MICARLRQAWLLSAALCLAVSVASAHNPDTSYAKVAIERDRLDLRFTFDVFTLQKVTDLDADRNGEVTPEELKQAGPAIERFVRGHVRLELNGVPSALGDAGLPEWPRDGGEVLKAPDWHSANSLIAMGFRISPALAVKEVSIAFDYFETLGTRHTVLGAFTYGGYSEEVTFTQPEPDYLFDVTYASGDSANAATPPAPLANSGLWPALARFFKLGLSHIFTGFDHVLFLVALMVVGRFRDLVKIVTSFTVAHSITLILAALEIVRLPGRWVECAIAATIVYVAVENLFRRNVAHRWMLTFCFGLIHGFGFAGTLVALGLPAIGRVRCLLAFNVGVEAAQLLIIAAAFPLVAMLGRWRYAQPAQAAISAAVGVCGLNWLLARALGMNLFGF